MSNPANKLRRQVIFTNSISDAVELKEIVLCGVITYNGLYSELLSKSQAYFNAYYFTTIDSIGSEIQA